MSGLDIGARHVGDGAPCLIVAEIAQAHEGSLSLAHAYIDAAADAGADAVKFQCHIAEAESTPDEPWRVAPKWSNGETRYEYWQRTAFNANEWYWLKHHANERGLIFLCSPFSVEAVTLLDPLVPAWKVASGEVANIALLDAISETRKPLLISTGMSTQEEIESLVWAAEQYCPLALLQCTSQYPTPPEHVGLDALRRLRRHRHPAGLSDHSGTIYAGLAAVALGCDVLEVHITFSREMQGFDTASSITTAELRQLVEGVRFIEKARQPVDKDALAKKLEPMRELFMRKHERKAASGRAVNKKGPSPRYA